MDNSTHIDDVSNYKRALMIASVLFVSYAYFFEGGGWNQNSRFDLTRAIVEKHTLTIDAYHNNTGDKAFSRGHYYSEKAPGVAFLAVPFVAAARPALRLFGVDPTSIRGLVALAYLATLGAVALPAALGVGCLFLIALRLGATVGGASFAALSLGLATPYWANSSMLFGHTLAGACLILAFSAAVALRDKGPFRRDLFLGVLAGFAAGCATVTEYPAAPASAVMAILVLVEVWPDGWQRRGRVAAGVAAGALVCVAVLMTYQYYAFGSPFDPGYSHYPPGVFPRMQTGFHGLTYPHPGIILRIFLSRYSGLLLLGPVIVAAPVGLWLLWKERSTRNVAIAGAIIATYYVCFNASFVDWKGGASYGPRYMLAGLPAFCLGLAPAWSYARQRFWRRLLIILATAGTLLSLAAVSTNPIVWDHEFPYPMFQTILPSFFAGRLSSCPTSVVLADNIKVHEAFNLGQLVGLHGVPSLIPLLSFWCLSALILMRIGQPQGEGSGRALLR
jgi:hypothetical protein